MAGVEDYIAALPDDRREALARVREVIREAAPEAAESIRYGMPYYELEGDLCALASQKNYMSFYLMSPGEPLSKLREQAGLDIGKGCVRFKRLDDLPLDLVGEAVSVGAEANRGRARK